MSVELTKATAMRMAGHYDKEAQRLIDQYGTGVRPSWVSCDLGIAQHHAARWRKLAEVLKDEADG
ncbi:MAG: hypothetical protein COZ24_06425 [Hydrogenophilales bacterium CG_4_10_14_3_um_filter_63_21]|nr:MAG: hypothetical protein COZ24_06425 [Hydrogenophilales bacterium CG_4_10_14_3_um_filter_63_21]